VTVSDRRSTSASDGVTGRRLTPGLGHDGPMSDEPAALLELAQLVGERAAALLVGGLQGNRTIGTKSTGTDLVTEMDRAAERMIVDGILRARPDDGILGEEGTDRVGTSPVRWLIDPLDGTTNYVYGHPGFAVSIAAEVEGEVTIGVVVDPLHDDVFTAVAGGGAWRNGSAIEPSGQEDLDRALIATGFSYDSSRRDRQARVLTVVLPRVRDIRRMGAAAVDLCSVACGRVDGFYEKGLAPWDYAAGALVAREAGATVGDLDGGPPSGVFVLASGPALFEPLGDLLRGAGAAHA
jgi:myo-inositol-1(or 4)-monophosphatase